MKSQVASRKSQVKTTDGGLSAAANRRLAPRTCRAFTLIEMLVLIIIIAVISSVAVPAYTDFFERARFRAEVQRVVELLAWAREAALQQDSQSVVRFDAQTGTFRAEVETPQPDADVPTAVAEAEATAISPPETRSLNLTEHVMASEFSAFDPLADRGLETRREAGAQEIRFRDDGSSDAARFVLRSPEGFGAVIEVVPTTGRVVVTDENETQ